jgi:hypothetical protein
MNWEEHWRKQASQLLKAELTRRGVTYKQLTSLLPAVGGLETEASITQKLGRGRFQLAFFLQCLKAIGVQTAHIDILGLDGPTSGPAPTQPASLKEGKETAAHRKRVEAALREAAKSSGKK